MGRYAHLEEGQAKKCVKHKAERYGGIKNSM